MIRCSKWSTFRCCKWSLNPVWRGSAFGKPFPSHINPRVSSQFLKVLRSWPVLHILTSKCASRHNGVQFFISHLARWLRTRRFSESKGWMRALCSFADYLVTSVHLRGSPENVLFPESIPDQKSRKRGARRMENPKKSCPRGLAQLCGLAQFCGLSKRSQPFFFWQKIEKHMNPWDGYIPLRRAHKLLL